ncbi:MAG: SH3 domain-containing protein [Anaerolineae bacterium]|nr:SH3 domain-containing protein [Anaerolineae bacterium]
MLEVRPFQRITAYEAPSTSSRAAETLLWGDRFLWTSDVDPIGGTEWREVVLGSGGFAWIPYRSDLVMEADPHFFTPGSGIGAQWIVLDWGAGANIRSEPATYAELVRQIDEGERLTIIGGPYQAEFQMWWQVRAERDGATGWLIDLESWYQVNRVAAGRG